MSNTSGKLFKVTSFGSSHGKALGAVIDGCPANLELSTNDIQKELNKRKPGTSNLTTSRGESDEVEILSGIFNGKTDGTPITGIVRNNDNKSKDYEYLHNTPRPAHGDYCWMEKYGNYDYFGGGRGSGRATIGHVIGGAVAKKLIATKNISVVAHVIQVGDIKANKINMGLIEEYSSKNNIHCADNQSAKKMEELILSKKEKGDSVGGIVEILVFGAPVGLGEPVFGKLDGELASILMGIGSVKGVEIGWGFDLAHATGYETNDEFYINSDNINSDTTNTDNNNNNNNNPKNNYKLPKIFTSTNTSGGILGGMSNGMPISIKIAVKPTPSISFSQKTVDLGKMKDTNIEIKGRHDPCICSRITPVSESSVAIVIADMMIRGGFIHPSNLDLK